MPAKEPSLSEITEKLDGLNKLVSTFAKALAPTVGLSETSAKGVGLVLGEIEKLNAIISEPEPEEEEEDGEEEKKPCWVRYDEEGRVTAVGKGDCETSVRWSSGRPVMSSKENLKK